MAPAHIQPMASRDLLQLERDVNPLEARLRVCQKKAGQESVAGDKVARACPPMPESSVLGRVKAFLPILNEANQNLFTGMQVGTATHYEADGVIDQVERGAEQFDIEVVTGGEGRPYIEMDLALGIADLCTPEAVVAAELAANGQFHGTPGPTKSSSESDGDAESDSDEDSDEDLQHRRSHITELGPIESPDMVTSALSSPIRKRSKVAPL